MVFQVDTHNPATAKGIATNGRINFEITKAIMKCNYEKAAFKNFTQMESVINAEIKYEGIEEAVKLESKKTSKLFDESYTKANLVINKPTLTTLQTNEDVEYIEQTRFEVRHVRIQSLSGHLGSTIILLEYRPHFLCIPQRS